LYFLGGGYTLTLVKDVVGFSLTKVTNFVRKYYPHSVPSNLTVMEVTYQLEDSSLFPDLLNSLEQTKQSLGIKEYGITLTTLQDVFMRYVGGTRVARHTIQVYLIRVILLLLQSRPRRQQEVIRLSDERDKTEINGIEEPFRHVVLRRRVRFYRF